MKKSWYIAGIVFTVIVGTLLHFVYEWSGSLPALGAFAAVNESIWEHLKLIFWPFLLFSIMEYFAYGKDVDNYIPVKVLSVLLGMGIIVAGFYTYTGILGENLFVLDIILFLAAVYFAFRFSNKNLGTERFISKAAIGIAIFGAIILILAFVIFTYKTPELEVFRDPLNGGFGINAGK